MFSQAKSHVKGHQHLKLLVLNILRLRMEIKNYKSDQKQLMIQLHSLSRIMSISTAMDTILPDEN